MLNSYLPNERRLSSRPETPFVMRVKRKQEICSKGAKTFGISGHFRCMKRIIMSFRKCIWDALRLIFDGFKPISIQCISSKISAAFSSHFFLISVAFHLFYILV